MWADHVYQDLQTGKSVIAGAFNSVRVAGTPGHYPYPTFVYAALCEVYGTTTLTLHFVDLQDNRMLLESSPVEITCEDPLELVQIAVPVPPLPVPHEGAFAMELLADGVLLGALRIRVEHASDD